MFPNLTSTKTCLCQLTLALTINIDRHSSLFLSLGHCFLPPYWSFGLAVYLSTVISALSCSSFATTITTFVRIALCSRPHIIALGTGVINQSVKPPPPHHHKREINSLLVSIQNPITYVPRGGCCLHTRLCKLPGCV